MFRNIKWYLVKAYCRSHGHIALSYAALFVAYVVCMVWTLAQIPAR